MQRHLEWEYRVGKKSPPRLGHHPSRGSFDKEQTSDDIKGFFSAVIFDSNSLLNWCNSISALIRVRICIPDNFIPDLHKWIFIRSSASISSDYTLNIRYLFAVSFPNTGKFISERNFSWNFSRFLSGVSNRRDIVIFSKSLYSSATHKIDECIIRAAVGFHRESGPFFRL